MKEFGFVKSIYIYPIKSLDGIEVQKSSFNRSGGLKYDRRFSLKDLNGEFVNAKKYPEIIQIRSEFDLEQNELSLSFQNNQSVFNLESDQKDIEKWFSDFFNKNIKLHKNTEAGFPDDINRSGPTFYSTQSLELIHTWFPELSIDELRRRFRGNIELEAEKSGFWEDELLLTATKPGVFKVGQLEFQAIKPCPRCPVPSRDSYNSSMYSGFQKKFTEERKKNIRSEIDKNLFPHYYMFGLNTISNQSEGQEIHTGDKVISN